MNKSRLEGPSTGETSEHARSDDAFLGTDSAKPAD